MSNPSDRPWTEEDKYALLTEILKKAGIPSGCLVRLIREYGINPSWEHIPLPQAYLTPAQGRSLSSCKNAFLNMIQQPAHPPHPTPFPRDTGPTDMRKRPLFPSDKPVPRAIQPRPPGPPASTVSYGSESGSSAQLSPRLDTGEPRRKRGRPSKAETERRKLLAESRGEPYPAPRRPARKAPSPTSPAPTSFPTSFQRPQLQLQPQPQPQSQAQAQAHAQAQVQTHAQHQPQPQPQSQSQPIYEMRPVEGRDIQRNMMRELPRPTEMGHPLPSPHALQLGPPDAFPRPNPERGYEFFQRSDGRRDSAGRPEHEAEKPR
ncbi:uncharacterized protein N7506_008100 [Penicillium brevicompactum]|uniref:uncharacterized protein n=1 Tax=Penicillium brevicompactum TaxID=5074 RepID=UPI0025414ABE|nr:uncharacterized protein N7506_008100 [Penicillium brevicompactum]KAJ5334317.1 hypothetical protein N7506_008100 [Penicillium brevicompactum]